MQIIQVETPEHLESIRELFREYFQFICDYLGVDLGYQGVAAELAALPGYYAPPRGRLLIALDGEQPAGCVALRAMEGDACEIKRMYVKPAYQGQGLGRALGERVIEEARQIGYKLIRLDTAERLTAARQLYTSLGFCERAPYYQVPPDVLRQTVFMEMSLATGGRGAGD